MKSKVARPYIWLFNGHNAYLQGPLGLLTHQLTGDTCDKPVAPSALVQPGDTRDW